MLTFDVNAEAGLALVADNFLRDIRYVPLEHAPPERGHLLGDVYTTIRQMHHVARKTGAEGLLEGWSMIEHTTEKAADHE